LYVLRLVERAVGSAGGGDGRAIILVEGDSDRVALEAVAARLGRDLTSEGISVVAMYGATNIARSLDELGPRGLDVVRAGLYDAAEEPYVRRGLERAGFGSDLARADLERLGFFACEEDLEEELIRALGAEGVLDIVRERGELRAFRSLTRQPPWRGRPVEQQLRRFLGNASRKFTYAPLLVEALDLSAIPRPLVQVLAHVERTEEAAPSNEGSGNSDRRV
jgi:hypothetical protein